MRIILHVGDRALDLSTLVRLTRDERTFSTFEAWKRAVRLINPKAVIEGDRDIANAPGVGEWDGEKGVIYDSAVKDQLGIPESEEFGLDAYDAREGVYFSARPLGGGSWGIRTLTYRGGALETENLNTTPWPTEEVALQQAERAARGEAEREGLPFRGRTRDDLLDEMVKRAMVEVRYALSRGMNLEEAIAYAKERSTAGPRVWEIIRQRGGRDAAMGSLGGYEYTRVDTSTLEGLKKAEQLQAAGWKIIQSGLFSILFERKVGGSRDSYSQESYRGFMISESPSAGFIISKGGVRYGSKPTIEEAKKEIDSYVAQGLGVDSYDAGDVRIVYNRLLGGWYIVRGPHQTPISGRFNSKEEAEAHLGRRTGDELPSEMRERARKVYESALRRASDPAARAEAKEDYEATLREIELREAG